MSETPTASSIKGWFLKTNQVDEEILSDVVTGFCVGLWLGADSTIRDKLKSEMPGPVYEDVEVMAESLKSYIEEKE